MLKIECTGLGSIHAAIQVPYRTVGQNKICVSLFELFSCTNIGKAITMTVFSSHQYFIGWVLVLLFVPETKALTLEASRTVLFFYRATDIAVQKLDQVFSVDTRKHAS